MRLQKEDILDFGKHKGSSIEEIWVGSKIDLEYFQNLTCEYLDDFVSIFLGKVTDAKRLHIPRGNLQSSETEEKLFQRIRSQKNQITYLITSKYLIIESLDNELSQITINLLHSLLQGRIDSLCTMQTLPEDLTDLSASYSSFASSDKMLSINGDPSYIQWLIKNTDYFIDNKDLDILKGIKKQQLVFSSEKVNSDILYYSNEITLEDSFISNESLSLNKQKETDCYF